jgi:hypothetical protein
MRRPALEGGRLRVEAGGGVVEEGEDCRGGVLVAHARVVLVGEVEAGPEGEGGRAVRAAELPDDGPVRAGDVVDGGRVARGDEIVAGRVFVDRVDVEVVPGQGGVEAGAGAGGVGGVWGDGAVGGRDVAERGPFEEQFVGG